MIPRYSLPAMAELWTEQARFATWLEVEVLAVEAWSELGVVPEDHARQVRDRAPVVDEALVRAVHEREAVTDHDVAAFVDVVQDAIGPPAGSWVHYGLTSYDVVRMAPPVLRHRLLLRPEAELERYRVDDAVAAAIAAVPVPR